MVKNDIIITWIDDELSVVRRNKEIINGCFASFLFSNLLQEVSRYERALKTLKRCIELGIYD